MAFGSVAAVADAQRRRRRRPRKKLAETGQLEAGETAQMHCMFRTPVTTKKLLMELEIFVFLSRRVQAAVGG